MNVDMSKLKQLKLRHIATLAYYNYNFKEFLLITEDAESYKFYHIPSGKPISIRR